MNNKKCILFVPTIKTGHKIFGLITKGHPHIKKRANKDGTDGMGLEFSQVFVYYSALPDAQKSNALDRLKRPNSPFVIISTNALEAGVLLLPGFCPSLPLPML